MLPGCTKSRFLNITELNYRYPVASLGWPDKSSGAVLRIRAFCPDRTFFLDRIHKKRPKAVSTIKKICYILMSANRLTEYHTTQNLSRVERELAIFGLREQRLYPRPPGVR